MRAPVSFAKSTREGGSFRKAGPTKDAATGDTGTTAAEKIKWLQMRCKEFVDTISYIKTRQKFYQNVKLSLCTPSKNMGSGGTTPLNLNLDTKWRILLSFTLRPLYPSDKKSQYALNSCPQTLSGCSREGKDPAGNRTTLPRCPVRSLVTTLTELSCLHSSKVITKGRF